MHRQGASMLPAMSNSNNNRQQNKTFQSHYRNTRYTVNLRKTQYRIVNENLTCFPTDDSIAQSVERQPVNFSLTMECRVVLMFTMYHGPMFVQNTRSGAGKSNHGPLPRQEIERQTFSKIKRAQVNTEHSKETTPF